MQSICVRNSRWQVLAAAASAVSLSLVSSVLGQSNVAPGQVVISTAGSTALKNWFVAKTTTFGDIQPGTTLSINGVSYPTAADGGLGYWTGQGGTGSSYQLAPKNNTAVQGTNNDSAAALQVIYHESGSVEGILEMANDQLYTNNNYAPSTGIAASSIQYVTQNVDRNPEGGNAVWLNYNQIGASGVTAGAAFNATTGADAGNGLTLGNFYASGVGQTGTPGQSGTVWAPGSASNPLPSFNQAGTNLSGGQNAVQVALSDAQPQQIFANTYGNTSYTYTPVGGTPMTVSGTANTSFNANFLDQGYGTGNAAYGNPSGPGTAGIRATYQNPSVLNMPANAQNPRAAQGVDFGVGAWNNASNGGLGNLNSQLTAITATAFVANPGTGLTQVDRTDANWLEMTGRLMDGAVFNMTTRDVNSGTRNVSALDTGVDPSYAVGKNDDGNGNLSNAVSNTVFDQESIGPAQRFSNKTAGGAQLRPTVQNNRMAVGTLSINDAGGNDTQSVANPVRVLNYSDSVDGSAPYVSPNYATISNGTYVIYQNEYVVTIKAPNANYATNTVTTAANGAQVIQGQIQGDDATNDVVALLNNTANSVATGDAPTPANPADGLLSQGYIVPDLMQVQKAFNGEGLNNSVAGQIATGSIQSEANPNFNAALYAAYAGAGGYGPTALPVLTTQEPTTGAGSTYGGKGGTFAKSFFNGGAIPITSSNYLFGNFNQDGVRDYSAVQSALYADRALIAADQAAGASVPGSEFTSQGDNNGVAGGTSGVANTTLIPYTSALGAPITNLTKGDLIVMGDFTGDGHFDGADLVAMADGAALANAAGQTQLTSGDYRNATLVKNAAMDWLNTNVGNTGADQYLRVSGRAILEAPSVPSGATAVTNPITGVPVIDPVSGMPEFSYDPNGINTFNKLDVNRDGVIDMNDAVLADNNYGQDYQNIADQVAAVQQAPVTGNLIPLNLTMVKLSDGSSVIDSTDVAAINSGLAVAGNSNWYAYSGAPLAKTGPSTITWARPALGSTNTVYTGAAFNINGGSVQVASGSLDPFSDNTGSVATGTNHVAVTVNSGGTLAFQGSGNSSTVGGLTINGTGTVDVGGNTLIIQNTNVSTVRGYLQTGYNSGAWGGQGLTTSMGNPVDGLGYADEGGGLVKVQYAVLGDTNLDGSVNFSDLLTLATDYGMTGADWAEGDFNYDGSVNFSDLLTLATNYGSSLSPGEAAGNGISPSFAADWNLAVSEVNASVPEPTSFGLLAVGATSLLARRRRRATK